MNNKGEDMSKRTYREEIDADGNPKLFMDAIEIPEGWQIYSGDGLPPEVKYYSFYDGLWVQCNDLQGREYIPHIIPIPHKPSIIDAVKRGKVTTLRNTDHAEIGRMVMAQGDKREIARLPSNSHQIGWRHSRWCDFSLFTSFYVIRDEYDWTGTNLEGVG